MASPMLTTLDGTLRIPGTQPTVTLTDGTTKLGADYAMQGEMDIPGGAKVWLASQPNTRPDNGYQGNNSDNAMVMALPPLEEELMTPAAILSEAMQKVSAAAKAKSLEEKNGGTTGTAVWYDPKSYSLNVSSVGNSSAFIIFQDSTKAALLQINDRDDEFMASKFGTTNSLHLSDAPASGNCIIAQEVFRGSLDIEKLKAAACHDYGLNAATLQATLVLASDGIDALTKTYNLKGDEDKLSAPVHEAFKACAADTMQNPATAVTSHATESYREINSKYGKNFYDDATVMLMPLVKGQGGPDGGPVVLFVADGMGTAGQEFSKLAINEFTSVIHKYDKTASVGASDPCADTWAENININSANNRSSGSLDR